MDNRAGIHLSKIVPVSGPLALSLSPQEAEALVGSRRQLSFFRRTTNLSVCTALIRHFDSLKGLARASFQELQQFLPRPKVEAVVAALSMSAITETEHARSEQLDNPESIYRACADMKLFNLANVIRVIAVEPLKREEGSSRRAAPCIRFFL
jgi:hypothetical protein